MRSNPTQYIATNGGLVGMPSIDSVAPLKGPGNRDLSKQGVALRGIAAPKRDHGDPQFFGFEARATESWCGRRDLNPHGPCGPTDFLARYGFRRPCHLRRGLGSGLSLHRVRILAPGVRCCPSSLYTFPTVSGRAWLGIAMLQGSPNLSSSASPVSRRALKFLSSPMRLPIPPRPHGFKLARIDDWPDRTFKSFASADFAARAETNFCIV
jgi:hypothetical protein